MYFTVNLISNLFLIITYCMESTLYRVSAQVLFGMVQMANSQVAESMKKC